jgi:hypothetical protein
MLRLRPLSTRYLLDGRLGGPKSQSESGVAKTKILANAENRNKAANPVVTHVIN